MPRLIRRALWLGIITLTSAAGLLAADGARPTPSTTRYEYDGDGQVVRRWAPTGVMTRYQYDRAGSLTRVSYHHVGGVSGWTYPARRSIRFEYDLAGQRVAMHDASGQTTYEYDESGSVSAVSADAGARSTYEYDPWQRVKAMTLPGGGRIEYQHDLADRVTAVTTAAGNIRYRYEGQRMIRTLPNGIVTVREFANGRLRTLAHQRPDGSVIGRFDFEYDADGRVTALQESGTRTRLTRYEYDAADRLATVVGPGANRTSYRYDSIGNRVAEIRADGSTEYAYDAEGRLSSGAGAVFSYDDAGNLESRRDAAGVSTYRYDEENQLVEVTTGGRTIRYRYDGDGNRVAREIDGAVTHFLNSNVRGVPEVVAERQAGTGWSYYVFGDTRNARVDATGAATYFLEGPMNSTAWVVNSKGAELARYDYSPFGVPEAAQSGATFQYTGEPWDAETKLLYLRARYYDPSLGRFITADPQQGDPLVPATFNRYIYANSDPINNVDPLGRQSRREQTTAPRPAVTPMPVASTTASGKRPAPFIDSVHKDMENWALDVYRRHPNGLGATAIGFAALDYAVVDYAWRDLEYNLRTLGNVKDWRKNPGRVPLSAFELGLEFLPSTKVLKLTFAGNVPLLKRAAILEGGKHWVQQRTYLPFGLDPRYPGSKSFRAPLEQLGGLYNAIKGGVDVLKDEPPLRSAIRSSVLRAVDPFNLTDRVKAVFPQPPGGGAAPTVGGVYLDQTAAVLGELGAVVGAMHDPKTGRLVLLGDRSIGLPPLNPAYFAAALKAVYASGGGDLGMTIDPDPRDPRGPMMLVKYFGMQDLTIGKVAFESDRHLKSLSAGIDSITKQPVTPKVPGFRSVAEMLFGGASHAPGLWSRFWLVPEPVSARVSGDGRTILFDSIRIRVNTQTMRWDGGKLVPAGSQYRDETAEAFAAHFTEHYDDFAREYPIFEELRQVAGAVALAKWMHGRGIPLDRSFVDRFIGESVRTTSVTPSVRARQEQRTTDGRRTQIRTVEVFGGVEMAPQFRATVADDANNTQQAAISAWSGIGGADSVSFPVLLPNRKLTAIALPEAGHREVGGYARVESDALDAGEEMLALPGFTRHYSSFHNAPGPLGRGWTMALPRLEFEAITESGERSYLAVAGKAGTRVLVQRFALANTSPFGDEVRFDESFIDQDLKRVGFKPAAGSDFRGIYPDETGYHLVFTSGERAYFDAAGQLRSLTFAGGVATYDFDPTGKLTAVKVTRGDRIHQLSFVHDGAGRIAQANVDGRLTSYEYDQRGNLAWVRGDRTSQYSYDDRHRLVAVSVEGVQVIANEFDDAGRLTSQHHGEDTVRHTVDRTKGTVTSAGENGIVRRVSYDREFRPVRLDDGRGRIEERTYDAEGRLRRLEVALPTGGRAVLTVSDDRQTITSEDPRHVTTEYSLGPSGELLRVSVNRRVNRTYHYEAGRLSGVAFSDGSRETYEYTADGELAAVNRQPAGGFRERAQRIKDETQAQDPGRLALPASISVTGNIIRRTSASGAVTQHVISSAGLLESVRDGRNGTTSYGYDDGNRLVLVRLPNAQCLRYTYGGGFSPIEVRWQACEAAAPAGAMPAR